MASDWLAATITGVVGLGGIAGTIINARLQQQAQAESAASQQAGQLWAATRDERKAAYVQLLTHLTKITSTFDQTWPNMSAEAKETIYTAAEQLQVAHHELFLVANLPTVQLSVRVVGRSADLCSALRKGDRRATAEAVDGLLQHRAELWFTMREDLSERYDPRRTEALLAELRQGSEGDERPADQPM